MKNCLHAFLVLHLGLTAVVAQPVITNQPQSQTNIVGATVTFTVGATGAPPLSYQWVFKTLNNRLPGATNDTLVLSNVQASNAGNYRVTITNDAGSAQSASAVLTVLVPPTITRQPVSQFAELGDSTTISVTVTGSPPFSYQWLFNGQALAGETRSNVVWTSVAPSIAGAYSVIVTNVAGSIPSQIATMTVVPPIFTKITNGPVATDTGHSFACAWIDYDNDGRTDLMVANNYYPSGNQPQKSQLYRNMGGCTFARITNTITSTGGSSLSIAWGDYDNDGYADLFVTNPVEATNFLFRANGGDGFTRIMDGSVVTSGGVSHGGVWGDFDADGLLDLFVANYGEVPNPNLLFHNRGDGQFDKITFEAKPPGTGSSTSASWCDFDNDGDLDLFVTHGGWVGVQRNALYRNDGNALFARPTNALPPLDRGRSESSAWGDYDNDGYPDLFVANITRIEGGKNFLYRNNGDGAFTRIMTGPVAEDASDGIGCSWADFDNDGYLDLFVANGEYSALTNFLYRNNGDGMFSRVTGGSLGPDPGASAGCAWGDFDNDGFVDLFVSNHFGTGSQPPQRNFLYRNNGNSNAWLNVKLMGTASNRSAIGAKVRVKATIRGRSFWQLREVSGGNGFGSQNDLRANFGLGDATNVETLRIEWPSGTVQELHNVAARQFLTITEPPRLLASKTSGTPQFAIRGGRGFSYQIDTSTNLADWSPIGTVTITNLSGTAPILDTNAPDARGRFYRAVQP